MAARYDFKYRQGATFNPTLKYSQPQFTVKTITGVTKSGQAVVTAAAHGLTIDWPVWVVGVVGMTQVNHQSADLKVGSRAYYGYYVDANTIRLNLDTTRFAAYTSGGELLYHPPVNLTGFTARMQLRSTVESTTTIHSLTTANGGITLGGTDGSIALLISATDMAAFALPRMVYDLELVSGGGIVTPVAYGNLDLDREVTR